MLFLLEHLINAVNIGVKNPSCFCRFQCNCVIRFLLAFLIIAFVPVETSTHPRISELCADTFRGFEGTTIKGFKLQKAFVAVTPGHTSAPTDVVKALEGHKSAKVRAYPELLSVKKTVKGISGKSAFKITKALPSGSFKGRYYEHTKWSILDESVKEELSVLGLVQMVKLGEFLATKYFKQLQSIEAQPGESKNLAEITGELVHFQALSAFLHGLLMEKQFVAANVAKVGASFCAAAGHVGSVCSAAHSALQQLRFFVEEAFRTESLLFRKSKLTQVNVAALHSIGPVDQSAKEALSLISNKVCAERHHKRVEEIRQKEEELGTVSDHHLDIIFNISDSHVSYLASSQVFQSFAKFHSFSLLSYADKWLTCSFTAGLDDKSHICKDENDIKIVSVDSLSMLSLLSALSLPSSQHILPAARLIIEILQAKESELDSSILESISENMQVNQSSPLFVSYKKSVAESMLEEQDTRSKGKNLTPSYVRLLYNGKVVTSSISVCANHSLSNLGLCPYEIFKSQLLTPETLSDLIKSINKSEL